jgi:hypothetical protein
LYPDNDFGINVGCGAAERGNVHYNDSWNVLMVCNGTWWTPMQPPGTWCGYKTTAGALINCMGMDPQASCPNGYTMRSFVGGGASGTLYTCVKS